MERTVAAGGKSEATPSEHQLRQLSPLLVWAVVFCDIGTSIYYVPGILYDQVGEAAPLYVFAALVGFVLLGMKYIEICWRNPEGGGVVSVATNAFSPRWGLIGGLLICVDYFLTSAISSVSGIHYIASVMPAFDEHVVLVAVSSLALLAAINVIGIRESATISLFMALAALAIDVGVIGVTLVRAGPPEWAEISRILALARDATPRTFLIGFAGAWLAFSGLESISQLSPAMRLPIKATASKGMWFVILTILLTSPFLTLFSIALLPASVKDVASERFISELAGLGGGIALKIAVVATGSALLLFAANTAIIGSYHVFLALAEGGFMPALVAARNRRFGTPVVAIIIATFVPIAVVFLTGGDLVTLGELYAFGLLGAFVLSSLGLDVMRWRQHSRGLKFWIGVATTLMVVVAWFVNLMVKHNATIFGGLLVAIGLALAIGTQQKWFTDIMYNHPWIARLAKRRIEESEQELEAVTQTEILSLSQAEAIASLYPSNTLIAVRTPNQALIEEAIARERGCSGTTLYALYVEERTGLFVRAPRFESEHQSEEALAALVAAAKVAERHGFTLIPIWTVSHNAVEGIVRAAQSLGVSAIMIGVSQRGAIYHLLRGHVVHGLTRRLPGSIRLMLVG